jgi:hypothetical protein
MMSKHKDPRTVMRYDHGRENLDLNAVNFLQYEEEQRLLTDEAMPMWSQRAK